MHVVYKGCDRTEKPEWQLHFGLQIGQKHVDLSSMKFIYHYRQTCRFSKFYLKTKCFLNLNLFCLFRSNSQITSFARKRTYKRKSNKINNGFIFN